MGTRRGGRPSSIIGYYNRFIIGQTSTRYIIYLDYQPRMNQAILVGCLILVSSSMPLQSPVIGVYTQWDDANEPTATANFKTYIASSYVKFLQIAGAQVVPVFAYSDQAAIAALLSKLNGVLFPGGGEDINIANRWTSNADYILKYAINENKQGKVFPLWGTCLGMQLLAYLTADYDSKAISPVRGDLAIIRTLELAQTPSYLLGEISVDLKNKLTKGTGIVYFNHHYAVLPSYFASKKALNTFWNVIATTTTPQNDDFISVMEAKQYPFYVVQFHPQKNLFEWKVFADRTDSGAEVVQVLANKFVEQARKSRSSFASPEQFTKKSIYQYKQSETTMSFTKIYLFEEVKPSLTSEE